MQKWKTLMVNNTLQLIIINVLDAKMKNKSRTFYWSKLLFYFFNDGTQIYLIFQLLCYMLKGLSGTE